MTRAADEHDKWQRANWDKVHPMVRQDCLDGLRAEIPARLMGILRAQHNAKQSLGSHDVFFHLGIGMRIRNILRNYLTDGELPEVDYYHDIAGNMLEPWEKPPPQGFVLTKARNWDDYYIGALQELCEKP